MRKNIALMLMFIMLFFSGNPLTDLFGKYAILLATVLVMVLIKGKVLNRNAFYISFLKVVLFLVLIFFCQDFELGYVSWNGAFNFIFKIFLGSLIVNQFKEVFIPYLFKVVYQLTKISLVGFLLINILKLPIPGYQIDGSQTSYFLYSIAKGHLYQNDGMFWEPGAFAGIITLTLALNFHSIDYLWKHDRRKIIVMCLGVLTTLSTTGFIITFIIFMFRFFRFKNKYVAIAAIFILLPVSWYVYDNTEFLREKIEHQYEEALYQDKKEYSNTRFGSVVFDWHYIQKHPIIGNGFHESTRYSDHVHLQQLVKLGENLGSGNGFSNFLASMGCLALLMYFVLIFLNFRSSGMLYASLIIIVVLLDLQGEQWLNYPIFLCVPFIQNRKYRESSVYRKT